MNLNLKVGTRILAGYGAAVVLVGIVGAISYRATGELVHAAELRAHSYAIVEKLSESLSLLKDAETGQRGFLLTGQESYLEPYTAATKRISRDFESLRDLIGDNRGQLRRLAAVEASATAKLEELAETIRLRRERGEREALALVNNGRGKTQMDTIRQVLGEMTQEENDRLTERDRATRVTASFAMNALLGGGLGVLILVAVVGFLTQRSITGPLSSFMEFAGRVGAGDLTHSAKISSGDELGDLALQLDKMVVGLKDVAGQTRAATESLTSASAEILASTQQQATSTGEQAAAVQQTTTTMEEIAQSGAQISERAKQVAASAEATSAASHSGLQAVEDTARTMEAIREQAEAVAENVVALSEKTQAIGEIVATVNDLAEQSHLLALNAAIEAAAAGEQGRSFSVIASEVKNLADQSRDATVQVRTILGDIQKGINSSVMLTEEAVKRVESGKQRADVADRTIRQMTDSIHQSVQAFQQIVAGSNQQQIGFTQVMQALRDIGQASQQTASGTRQLEKSAMNLTVVSQQLTKAVERYKV